MKPIIKTYSLEQKQAAAMATTFCSEECLMKKREIIVFWTQKTGFCMTQLIRTSKNLNWSLFGQAYPSLMNVTESVSSNVLVLTCTHEVHLGSNRS